MAKRKNKSKKKQSAQKAAAKPVLRPAAMPDDSARLPDDSALMPDIQIGTSNLALHDLFQQQAAKMLDRADISDEQKQNILLAMSCPCCGAGGMSFTAKLRR